MKKLLIRGDRLLLALRCFSFLETCAQLGDAELAAELGFGDIDSAILFWKPETAKDNPHKFSLEQCGEVLQRKKLLRKEQRDVVGMVFGEYSWPLGVLHDFMETNTSQLSAIELDLSYATEYLTIRQVNQWVKRFFQLFASAEITEEMLKE